MLPDINAFLIQLASKSPLEVGWILFIKGGWIILAVMTIRAMLLIRLYQLQGKYLRKFEYVLLAIDVPKASEQTPKAMEQVFATITGAHQEISRRTKYGTGEVQLQFSFEVVSLDGYVQFLVYTPKIYRDLVEGAIYSQYPDCEITEVEDYTKNIPSVWPNDQYKLWGSEIVLAKKEAYPLRTYPSFEDQLSQELKDPLASLIENMSRIHQNEQVWLQMILVPTENVVWVKRALKEAYKIAGKKTKEEQKTGYLDRILSPLYNFPNWFSWLATGGGETKRDQQFDFRVLNLTPGERASVEAIEKKASKLGYIVKMRIVYLSTPEQYQPAHVINSVFGAIKQFGDLTSNSLKPNKKTKTSVVWFKFRSKGKQIRLMRNYKNRSWFRGSKWYILNVEELATLYHFPSITVTSPYLKRTETKKGEAPVQLPASIVEEKAAEIGSLKPQLEGLDFHNDYYEQKYGKYRVPKPQNLTEKQATVVEKPTLDTRSDKPEQEAESKSTAPSNLPLG